MRIFTLILTVIAGIVLNIPYHNFQDFLAQGDHGRDLYAAQAVLRGDIPYKDFWWVYGPLMPYYYALFFKFLGVHIPSVLLGKIVLNVLAGIFLFLGLSELVPAIAACLGAIWFMAFHSDFFFTYNHAGGITLMLAALWMHCAYIKTTRINYGWGALAAVFILGLIKINFAATTLIMTLLVVAIVDSINKARLDSTKKAFCACGIVVVPLGWLAVYAYFIHGLTITEIRQCLPYLGGDEPYNFLGPLQTIPLLMRTIVHNIIDGWINMVFCVITLGCTARMLYVLFNKNTDVRQKTRWALVLGYALIFYTLNLHEFLKSGVFYRVFWSQPLSMFLTFVIIAFAIDSIKSARRYILWAVIALLIAFGAWHNIQRINAYKSAPHFLGSSLGGVYITNDRAWMQTVVLTTRQLNATLKDGESFFALPYDCLYYYLTDKRSPTRQLILFDHIKIPFEQEESIIHELEKNNTTTILVSSRQSAREQGLGTLGVSYCPMIAQYISTNFTATAKIGDWVNEPGWAWNHGTLILKKNAPLEHKQ